ncbi:MAG: flagellar basal body rod protein FlgC [candidate division Zixibacteria bacterium]|nr:flagellar basal body rod protein FlgC [candidate division Zixibacteria bacterium]
MGGLLNAIELSAKGLSVQRAKMNVTAQNIANAETTRTEEGGAYNRQRVVVAENKVTGSFSSYLRKADVQLARTNQKHLGGGMHAGGQRSELSSVDMQVIEDRESEGKMVHDPSHPDANEEGYVKYPDIEIVNEMVDMMAASRAYEANTVAISTAKKMAETALDI